MAQNVTIAGASYTDVPGIEVPKTGGGSALFVDTSDADAIANSIQKDKAVYVNGEKIVGTAELVYNPADESLTLPDWAVTING